MRWRVGPFIGYLLALAGCGTHAGTMHDVRQALAANELDEARARLAEAGRGTDDLLFALEDGLLLHIAGDPALSNARFAFAEHRVDDLYTKSITRAALSFITSDLILKFEPRGIENFLINYYRALNYLELGEPEEAWVEWRRLAAKLRFSRDQGGAAYLDPPFFSYLVGLGLEADDPNDAYISLRLAEAAYRGCAEPTPGPLVNDLVRLAGELGFADHTDVYRGRYGTDGSDGLAHPGTSTGERGWGELVVLVEEGLVAPIEEIRVYIPITTDRAKSVHDGGRNQQFELAGHLAREYHAGRYRRVTPRWERRREIAYVLPLALPVFGRGEPAFQRLVAAAGGDTVVARPLLDVSGLQRAAFEDRLLGIYAKTIARAIVKAAAAAQLRDEAEEEGGDAAGDVMAVLTNAANIATERADTRAWLGLPHRIWVARLRLPPGDHRIRLILDGRDELLIGPIGLAPRQRKTVSYRVF